MTAILRTSERSDFLRCQQRWWWTWREGLRKRGGSTDALWFGTGIHQALAAWYCGPGVKRGPHPAETWEKFAADEYRTLKIESDLDEEAEAKFVDAKELGIAMMNGYVEKYGRDEQKLVISPEQTFRLTVPWPADQALYAEEDSPNILFEYCGTFDSVWRDAATGKIWLDEHKTAASITTGHLTLDAQAGSYWAVATRTLRDAGLIGARDRLQGIEYNFMRKGLPDPRPKDPEGYATNLPQKADYVAALMEHGVETVDDLPIDSPRLKLAVLVENANFFGLTVLGTRSKQQPPPLFVRQRVVKTNPERTRQLVRLQQEGLHMFALKDGVLPILKNPTRDCGYCPYFEMCELDEQGGDWEGYKDAVYDVQDPYAAHR